MLKTIKEHQNAILNYYREIVKEYETLFDLRCYMLEKGICPRCGTRTTSWSSERGHFPCWECGFSMTPWEIEQTIDNYNGENFRKKGYLSRALKKKTAKDFVPFSKKIKRKYR